MPQRRGDHGGRTRPAVGGGMCAQHQTHRGLAKHAGRFAVGAAIDFAARAAPQCRARCPQRSSARVLQTKMCAQVRMRTTGRSLTAASRSARVGRAAVGESRFVVAAAVQPGPRRKPCGVCAQPRRHVGDAGGAAHVEQRGEQVADLPDVRVGVDESRDRASARPDPPPACPGRAAPGRRRRRPRP